MKEKENVRLTLESVTESNFRMSPNLFDETAGKDMRLGFSNIVDIDVANNSVKLTFGVIYSQHKNTIVECVYDFIFSVSNLQSFIEHDSKGSMVLNGIMPHFLSVAVGTMRGILVAKTAGTIISRFPIPIINVNQLNEWLKNKKNNQ